MAQAGFLVDDEDAEPWKEGEVAFPAYPDGSNLFRFYVSATTPNTFLVDTSTISVGADSVVRYVLVIRSRSGAENVTFEGIRCATGERRIYAIGQQGRSWTAARESAWNPISFNTYNRAQAALAQDYFCDGPAPVINATEALRRLKRGGARGTNPVLDEEGRL